LEFPDISGWDEKCMGPSTSQMLSQAKSICFAQDDRWLGAEFRTTGARPAHNLTFRDERVWRTTRDARRKT